MPRIIDLKPAMQILYREIDAEIQALKDSHIRLFDERAAHKKQIERDKVNGQHADIANLQESIGRLTTKMKEIRMDIAAKSKRLDDIIAGKQVKKKTLKKPAKRGSKRDNPQDPNP